ncbi:MAG: hypothetical protein IJ322_00375 [Clostridia bacterium]|nr:hypothetical protein [Clostridia bacterium]
MITKGEILLIPLVLTLFLCRAVMGLFKEMDKNLNYSMKKKIKWWIFKNLYFDNRRGEYLHGPVLENPNCGVYFPVFILILVQSLLQLTSIIWSLILIFTEYTNLEVKIMTIVTCGSTFIVLVVAGILDGVYQKKFVKHQSEYISKIAAILQERDK